MTVTPAEAAALVRERFGGAPAVAGSVVTVTVDRAVWAEVGRVARGDLGCAYFNWLSAVDWKADGLEVLARVENLDARLTLVMRTRVPADDPHCSTLTSLWRGADWMERECYDMFGVVFDGHPDLRRILLGQDWVGHPLRKDWVDTGFTPYR